MLTQVNAKAEKATILHHQSTAMTREGPDGHKDDTATGSARTHNLAFQLTFTAYRGMKRYALEMKHGLSFGLCALEP